MPARRLRSCDDTSPDSRSLRARPFPQAFPPGGPPTPAAHLQGALRVGHLRGVRLLRFRPRFSSTLGGAFPVRAPSALSVSSSASPVGESFKPTTSPSRSSRRGSPRAWLDALTVIAARCRLLAPRNRPATLATPRVRRPTLPPSFSATSPRSHRATSDAPLARRRRHNPRLQRTGTRLALGASRRQARASR